MVSEDGGMVIDILKCVGKVFVCILIYSQTQVAGAQEVFEGSHKQLGKSWSLGIPIATPGVIYH